MMYNQKLAAAIKSNGKVLREFKDKVYLPFGSEYSILIKNLNSVRALVNVFIDGTKVTNDGLVINAGSEIDFERSIANGNLDVGNKFKFIERTSDIEDFRGIKLEDGIVRIEYAFEKKYPTYRGPYTYDNMWYGSGTNWSDAVACSSMPTASASNSVLRSHATASVNNVSTARSFNEAGITVPGGKSDQKFISVSSFLTEDEKHSIVLNILGETPDNKPVVQSVTVKHKPKCPTCGTQNKAHAKFCNKCGTALEIFA